MVPQSEKVVFEKKFWNGRMVGKQKSSTRVLRIDILASLVSDYWTLL